MVINDFVIESSEKLVLNIVICIHDCLILFTIVLKGNLLKVLGCHPFSQ